MIDFFKWVAGNLENFSMMVMLFGCITMLIWWHIDTTTRFDIRDLLIDSKTKELSIYKVGQFFALIVSSYIVLHETRAGRLTEWLLGLYMIAWSGVNMVNKYLTKDEEKKPKEDKPKDGE